MSDNNTFRDSGRENMNSRLLTWSFRLLAAFAVCLLAGCHFLSIG